MITQEEKVALDNWPLGVKPDGQIDPFQALITSEALGTSPAFRHFRSLWREGYVTADGYLTKPKPVV